MIGMAGAEHIKVETRVDCMVGDCIVQVVSGEGGLQVLWSRDLRDGATGLPKRLFNDFVTFDMPAQLRALADAIEAQSRKFMGVKE